MAKHYRPVQRDQLFLLPPDIRDWLPQGHPVWLVIEVVRDHLDLSAFHAMRKRGGAGAAGYDPVMMVTLLVWAYAHKVTSSRQIERLCRTDAAFMVICAGSHPGHSTITRFRAEAGTATADLFAEVLGLCARLGMGRLGVVALDGMKVAASASKSANRTMARLREMAAEMAAGHAANDAAEDKEHGPGRSGDEVPGDLRSPQSRAGQEARDARIRQAREEMEAEEEAEQRAAAADLAAAAGEFRRRKAAGQRTGPAPAGAEVELAQEKIDAAVAARQARIDDWNARDAADRAAGGPGLSRRTRPRTPAGEHVSVRKAKAKRDKARQREDARAAARAREQEQRPRRRNITDPDSRLMPVRGGGFIQGCNTQNYTSQDGLIIATDLTRDTGDMAWFAPMTEAAEAAAEYIAARQPPAPGGTGTGDTGTGDTGDTDTDTGVRCARPLAGPGGQRECGQCGRCLIGLILCDCGYLSEDNLTTPGPDRLIATGKHRALEKAARHPDGDPAAARGRPAGPATAAMAARLQTEEGITAYRQRGHIAETPHGNIKHNLGFRQFTVRGTPKVTSEWHLITSVHNLFKAISAGKLTAQALADL